MHTIAATGVLLQSILYYGHLHDCAPPCSRQNNVYHELRGLGPAKPIMLEGAMKCDTKCMGM